MVGCGVESIVWRTIEPIVCAILPELRPVEVVRSDTSEREDDDCKRQFNDHEYIHQVVVTPFRREEITKWRHAHAHHGCLC